MAEPLSIAVSITSLLSKGIEIYNFIDDAHSAPDEIRGLSRELQALCRILGDLEKNFSNGVRHKELWVNLKEVLENCMEKFQQLQDLVDVHIVKTGDIWFSRQRKRLWWPFREKEVVYLRAQLEAHKSTLNIALLMSTYTETTSAMDKIGGTLEDVLAKLNREDGESVAATTSSSIILRRYLSSASSAFSLRSTSPADGEWAGLGAIAESKEEGMKDFPYLTPRSHHSITKGYEGQGNEGKKGNYGGGDASFRHSKMIWGETKRESGRGGGDGDGDFSDSKDKSRKDSNVFLAGASRDQKLVPLEKAWVPAEEQVEFNAPIKRHDEDLYIAALNGQEQVVRVLLEKDANANAWGEHYGNALQAAAHSGHRSVVQMLLEKGANINAQGGYHGNALQAAAYGGHKLVVQVLLQEGANVNAQGGYHGNALQAAAIGGYKSVVEMLLEKGADVNAQGGHLGNALQAAVHSGHEPVLRVLLGKGVDVNAQGGFYGNALQAATLRGHMLVAHMLLKKGADVNIQGGHLGNSLQAAALRGHIPAVQMFLKKGADINAQGGYYGNALQAAAFGSHIPVVQMLLEKGADVNACGGISGNALQAATSGRHEQAVQQLLLRWGARKYNPGSTDDVK